jgi:RNA polymerase sigma factor (sigma-70 family)
VFAVKKLGLDRDHLYSLNDPSSRTEPAFVHGFQVVPADQPPSSPLVVVEADRRYGAFLLGIAERELGSDLKAKFDAADIVQETLLEVFRESYRFQGLLEGEFKALLVRILLNNLIGVIRQYRRSLKRSIRREISFDRLASNREFTLNLIAETPSPDSSLVEREQQERLMLLVEELSERERTAFTLRSLHDRTYSEIGRCLGCSSVAARKLYIRVKERLRRELSDIAV